jgi:hypothetical protein
MDTLTGGILGGLLGATGKVPMGDLSRTEKTLAMAVLGALAVNLHKHLKKSPIDNPTPSIEAYRYKDSRRA